MKNKAISSQNRAETNNLNDIISDIPVGVCEVLLDDELTLLRGNEHFYELFGYTVEQMDEETENKIKRMIFREDVSLVEDVLREAQDAGCKGFEVEHRIMRRDGTLLWALVSGTFVSNKAGRAVVGVVLDITERKKMEEELRINEERFRIAFAQIDSTIFDYDIKTRVMIHADKSGEKYGIAHRTENVPHSLVETGVIHPDTVEAFLEMYRRIRQGSPTASCEVKTHLVDGRFLWQRISMTNIFDDQGTPVRAVGMLEDIDAQKQREEKLRSSSERDPLTGLYNKGAAERYIGKLMKEMQGKSTGAFYVIDIDDFKQINDCNGHLYGDKFLVEIGTRITQMFRADDIVGRIGGDEFVLFVGNIRNRQRALERAEALCRAVRKEFVCNGVASQPFCSIGGAFFPTDGTAFEELFQKADAALYEAKRSGKKQARIYREAAGEEQPGQK